MCGLSEKFGVEVCVCAWPQVAPLCSRRRGLFLSPSAVAAAGLRLLAHKSHSFDVRPRPPTLKRAEPDACGAGGGSGGGGGEGGTPLTPGHAAKRRCASLVEPNASPRKVSAGGTTRSKLSLLLYSSPAINPAERAIKNARI